MTKYEERQASKMLIFCLLSIQFLCIKIAKKIILKNNKVLYFRRALFNKNKQFVKPKERT